MIRSPTESHRLLLAGYQPGYVLRYPILALNIAAVVMVCGMAPLLGAVIFRGGIAALAPDFLRSPLDSAILLAVTVITTTIHELIHGGVLRSYHYRVAYGVSWRLLVAYAA